MDNRHGEHSAYWQCMHCLCLCLPDKALCHQLNFSVLRSIIGHQTACFLYLCPVWYQCSSLWASDRWAVSWSLNADMISSIRHLWRACQHNQDRCCGTLCSLVEHRRQSCFHRFEPQTECIIVIFFWSNIHYNKCVGLYGQIFNLKTQDSQSLDFRP